MNNDNTYTEEELLTKADNLSINHGYICFDDMVKDYYMNKFDGQLVELNIAMLIHLLGINQP